MCFSSPKMPETPPAVTAPPPPPPAPPPDPVTQNAAQLANGANPNQTSQTAARVGTNQLLIPLNSPMGGTTPNPGLNIPQ